MGAGGAGPGYGQEAEVRYIVSLSLTALMLCLVGATGAWAQSGVQRSSPFTDYRQAVQDEYSTPSTPGSSTPGTSTPGTLTPSSTAPQDNTQSPASQPDNGNVGGVEGNTKGNAGNGAGAVHGANLHGGGSSLPFTGLDLLSLVLLGMLLVAVGALIRVGQRTRRAVRLARS